MRHTDTADCASDDDLVRAFAGGDASAFEQLLTRHESSVYRICYLMTRSHEDARDLCQESFLLMYRGLPGFEGRAPFGAWARRVTVNLCLRTLKRRGREREAMAELAHRPTAGGTRPDHAAERNEERAALVDAIAQTRPEYRAVLILRDVEGLAYDEIREALGLTLSQVKTRLHRARREARERCHELRPGASREV